jgi:single-stranded-DNA-specific exonuclease
VASKREAEVTAQDLGFYVGPRLNAAGRLDDMTLGIRCLLATQLDEAMHFAQQLQNLNVERRQIEADMQVSALDHLATQIPEQDFTISLFQPDWHQGVIGILASRIKERYHRPVIVFADAENGTLKGSGRSIAGLHLRDALDVVTKQHPDLILKFGGHAMAAGLSINQHDFEVFKQAFEQVVRTLITEETLQAVMETDGDLSVQEMTMETAKLLDSQVWGQGFLPPLFVGTYTVIDQRILNDKHLKLTVQKDQFRFDAIYFNYAELLPPQVELVYALQINSFNGANNVQLMVKHAILNPGFSAIN